MSERRTLAGVDRARARVGEAVTALERAVRADEDAERAEIISEYEVSREMQRVIIGRMKREGIPARQAWREKDVMALGLRCAHLSTGGAP